MSVMFLSVASLWANVSDTPSSIKRFFVALLTTILLHPANAHPHGPVAVSGGPDGVRTRDHRIKSPTLYLTELQAQCSNLGFSSDLQGVLIHFRLILSRNHRTVVDLPNE